jgi:hypothetical protein
MSRKPFPWFAATVALALAPVGAAICRGDEFDNKLNQFQKQRAGEALALKRDVTEALSQADTLAAASPAKAQTLLRGSLSRLLDDSQLAQVERLALVRQVKNRLQRIEVQIAEAAAAAAAQAEALAASAADGHAMSALSPDWAIRPERERAMFDKPERPTRGNGQLLGGAIMAPLTPVVSADRRYVRLNVSGVFFFPNINNSYAPIQSAIPNVFYTGAPFGVTFGQPRNIFQVWVRQPQFTPISIQSGGLLIFP